jgi:hypothetical protein
MDGWMTDNVIQTTITSLRTISDPPSGRPASGAIFLLNNIAYLRAFLRASLLAHPTVELLQSNSRITIRGWSLNPSPQPP